MDLEKNYPTPRTGRTGRIAIPALGALSPGPSRDPAGTQQGVGPAARRLGGGNEPHFRWD